MLPDWSDVMNVGYLNWEPPPTYPRNSPLISSEHADTAVIIPLSHIIVCQHTHQLDPDLQNMTPFHMLLLPYYQWQPAPHPRGWTSELDSYTSQLHTPFQQGQWLFHMVQATLLVDWNLKNLDTMVFSIGNKKFSILMNIYSLWLQKLQWLRSFRAYRKYESTLYCKHL